MENSQENSKMSGRIFSINYSKRKGISKIPVDEAMLVEGVGLDGDAHAGNGLRQVSMLAIESIRRQRECSKIKKKDSVLKPGDFAENITTEGIDLTRVKIGDKLKIGKDATIEISQIGKECHRYCSIYYKIGDCIMPREGIFAEVLCGGVIKKGNTIEGV